MRQIYGFNRQPAQRNYTIHDLQQLKQTGQRLTMVNPANATEMQACVDAGIDLLTVWDRDLSLTREIAPNHFTVAGMNWSDHHTNDDILRHAISTMEAGADMYFTNRSYDVIEMLAKEMVPVQTHVGLVPTFSTWGGGLRAHCRTADEAMELYHTYKRLEDVGCVAVEIECVAEETLNILNNRTSIVNIGIGAGNAGDVVFLFMSDICGESENAPRHAHAFGNLAPLHEQMYKERVAALKAFHSATTAKQFPYAEQSITMHKNEEQKLLEALDKMN
jgi:3-methyl-2-oxobutanoate hydroxymethyltransferase